MNGYDELIGIVGQIIDSKAIDSLTALDTLQQIIDLLKANRNGSYLSIRNTLFSLRYFRHVLGSFLTDAPVIKHFVVAFDKLQQEAEERFSKADDSIQAETNRLILEKLSRPGSVKNFETEAIDFKGQLALPAPAEPSPSVSGDGE